MTLRWEHDGQIGPHVSVPEGPVLFVCSRNAARSQLAAAMWRDRTGREATSAGTDPAAHIDGLAREIAAEHGLALGGGRPRGYDEVADDPALVVSVCDRAREAGLPWKAPQLHWSVPDPRDGDRADYEAAYQDLQGRIDRLAEAVAERAA